MIKVNDKIGFRRTEYGKMEFGTYRGYADGKYTVELEDGEMVEMTTESYSGSRWCTKSPMSGMVHHIGWLVAKEDFEHCDRGYECAAWYENIAVKKGGRFPLLATTRKEYNSEKNEYVEYDIDNVYTILDGTVTSDEFGSRFCGVPVGNYDNSKNAGKASTHHMNWRGYEFAAVIRKKDDDYRFRDTCHQLGIPCDIEVFDNVYTSVTTKYYNEEDAAFYGKKVSHMASLNLLRATDEPLDVQVSKYLQANDMHCGAYLDDGDVVVEIEHGDWKHDHGRARWLVEKFFRVTRNTEVCDNQTVTYDDGSDNYSATHCFSEVR